MLEDLHVECRRLGSVEDQTLSGADAEGLHAPSVVGAVVYAADKHVQVCETKLTPQREI